VHESISTSVVFFTQQIYRATNPIYTIYTVKLRNLRSFVHACCLKAAQAHSRIDAVKRTQQRLLACSNTLTAYSTAKQHAGLIKAHSTASTAHRRLFTTRTTATQLLIVKLCSVLCSALNLLTFLCQKLR
jgi:hypothetical protein